MEKEKSLDALQDFLKEIEELEERYKRDCALWLL
jgi:hypothetical protein